MVKGKTSVIPIHLCGRESMVTVVYIRFGRTCVYVGLGSYWPIIRSCSFMSFPTFLMGTCDSLESFRTASYPFQLQ